MNKQLTYSHAVRLMNESDTCKDIKHSCKKLSQALDDLVGNFESMATQMNTLDLQRNSIHKLRPKWAELCQKFSKLVNEFRMNADFISGRIKIFCDVVLPLTARSSEQESCRSHQEKLHILQTFTNISADHAKFTSLLVKHSLGFNTELNLFHDYVIDLLPESNQKSKIIELSERLGLLEHHVKQLCAVNEDVGGNPDIAHLLHTLARVTSPTRRRTGKSKIPCQKLCIQNGLEAIGDQYEDFDRKRNEIVHANYLLQVNQHRTCSISNAHSVLATLLIDQMLALESGICLYLAIWARLRADCSAILRWITGKHQKMPPVISLVTEDNINLYSVLAGALANMGEVH